MFSEKAGVPISIFAFGVQQLSFLSSLQGIVAPRRYHVTATVEEMMRFPLLDVPIWSVIIPCIVQPYPFFNERGEAGATLGWIILEETATPNRAQLPRSADLYSWSIRVLRHRCQRARSCKINLSSSSFSLI